MHLVLRPWLLEWQKQNNSMYFRNVKKIIGRITFNNILQTAQQLQVSKVVAPTSQQALISRCVTLYLEYKQTVLPKLKFACMLLIKQCTLHLKFLFSPFQKSLTLLQKIVQQDRILQSFCPDVRRFTDNETIRVTQTQINYIDYIESSQHQIRKGI